MVKPKPWGLIRRHSLSVKYNVPLAYLFKMKDTFSHLTVLQCFTVLLLIYFVCIGKHGGDSDHRQGNISWDKSDRAHRHSPQFNLFKRLCLRRIARLAHVDILISEVFRAQFKIFLQIEGKIWNISATPTPYRHTMNTLSWLQFFLCFCQKAFCWVLFFQFDIQVLLRITRNATLGEGANSVQIGMWEELGFIHLPIQCINKYKICSLKSPWQDFCEDFSSQELWLEKGHIHQARGDHKYKSTSTGKLHHLCDPHISGSKGRSKQKQVLFYLGISGMSLRYECLQLYRK